MNLLNNPLYQAIIENVEDDTPRLVFADWLDEHEQPEWAEFIHVQCRLAAIDEADAEVPALQRRERELLNRNSARWLEIMPKYPGMIYLPHTSAFVRGLPILAIFDSLADFRCLWSEIVTDTPVEEAIVSLDGLDENRIFHTMMMEDPSLAHLNALHVYGEHSHPPPSLLESIAQSPHLIGLQSLTLDHFVLELPQHENSLLRILTSRTLAEMNSLQLRRLDVNSDTIRAIVSPDHSDRWRVLQLPETSDTDTVFGELLLSPALRQCQTLDLGAVWLENEVFDAFLESPMLMNLRDVDLGVRPLVPDQVSRLMSSPRGSQLRHLKLNLASSEAGLALVNSPASVRLFSLDVRLEIISPELARAFLESPAFATLRQLAVPFDSLDPEMEAPLKARFGDGFVTHTARTP